MSKRGTTDSKLNESQTISEKFNKSISSYADIDAKPSLKTKEDSEKTKNIKTILVYGQAATILVLFLVSLYLQYKISLFKKK